MLWSYDLAQTPAAAVLAVACTLFAAVLDHRSGTIPNTLTYPCLAAGLLLAAMTGGFAGLAFSLVGLLAASLVFLVAFMMGGCGGGDVKLMAALGAILGLWAGIDVTLAALMVGGVFALLSMLRRVEFAGALRMLGLFVLLLPVGLRSAGASLKPQERHTIRFGVAAAGGLLWCLLLPDLTPLSFIR